MRSGSTSRRVPHRSLWKRLYELAEQVKALAPWEWMSEIDFFGVRVPPSRDLVFVSVMGELGEHLAVAVYPDTRAPGDLLDMCRDEFQLAHRLLEIPQVQLSFEDRDFLDREDRAVLEGLNLSGRHRGALGYPRAGG